MAMVSYEPGDELCPRWWRWPGPHPHRMDDMLIPDDALLTLGMVRSLTIYNMAFQVEDAGAAREMRQMAFNQLQGQMEKLARSIESKQ